MCKQIKTYEFVINEIREYTVQGDGRNRLEAEQDAIARFWRLAKSYELVADTVSKPRIVREVKQARCKRYDCKGTCKSAK